MTVAVEILWSCRKTRQKIRVVRRSHYNIFQGDDVIQTIDFNAITAYNTTERKGLTMASITIRNLDDGIKQRLRVRAAEHGRSMEEEAREILREVVAEPHHPVNLAAMIRARVEASGGVDLLLPPREPIRTPPCFDG